jgi:uncharacterized membrane protein
MARVMTASVEIARPAGEVFEYIADFEYNPAWQAGMRSCAWTSEPPLRVGSTYEQEASLLGRSIRSSFVVTALEPGSAITIETTESTFPIEVTRTVEAIDADSCRVRATVEGGPDGFLAPLAPLMRVFAQRSVRSDYRRLKATLER